MKIVILDNYDSFTFNLQQQFLRLLPANLSSVLVFRNDCVDLDEIIAINASGIVISPGPGRPTDTGICRKVCHHYQRSMPILGVCLGHQLIGEMAGASVVKAMHPMHGKTSVITHNNNGLFAGLPNPLTVGRYHSLALEQSTIPEEFIVDAVSQDNIVMAVRHKTFPTFGLQFHPESFLTENGDSLILNFIEVCRKHAAAITDEPCHVS